MNFLILEIFDRENLKLFSPWLLYNKINSYCHHSIINRNNSFIFLEDISPILIKMVK